MKEKRQNVAKDQSLVTLEQEIRFDRSLKHKFQTKETKEAQSSMKFQKTFLRPLKIISIIFYYCIVPILQTPDWCTKAWSEYQSSLGNNNYLFDFFYDCKAVANGIRYSGLPMVSPLYTGAVDILCLISLCYFRLYMNKWRVVSPAHRKSTYIIIVLALISAGSTIYSMITDTYPWTAQALKPVIVCTFSSSTRKVLLLAFSNAKDSIAIIFVILLFIAYFTVIGYFLFRGTFEGFTIFSSPMDSLY